MAFAFQSPPYQLLIFLPLADLSFPIAHAIWSGLNFVLLAAILLWLLSYIGSPYSFFIVTAILAWFPTMYTFGYGQDSILTAALLLGVFIALKRQRDIWAGIFLALGLYKPQLVLPLAGALLVARRWHSIAAFTASGGILVAVSLLMVGFDGALDLVGILRSMEDYSYIINPRNMTNLRGLSHVALDGDHFAFVRATATGAVSLVLYGLCLSFWRQRWDVSNPTFDLEFSLVLVTTALISFHLYSHDLFLLTLALGLFFRHVGSNETGDPFVIKAFYPLILILLVPAVHAYAIEDQLFAWVALPLFLLYVILFRELVHQTKISAALKKETAQK